MGGAAGSAFPFLRRGCSTGCESAAQPACSRVGQAANRRGDNSASDAAWL